MPDLRIRRPVSHRHDECQSLHRLPWNIYGDQRDSLSQLDCGWIQAYAENAQESLDLALMSYFVAEHPEVSTPFMANLDGFVLTHTYEMVDVPTPDQADALFAGLSDRK